MLRTGRGDAGRLPGPAGGPGHLRRAGVPAGPGRGGKDGTIRHVMSGVNPQGVRVSGFKVPSSEELDHDYLWRYARRLPSRGEIGIFNRSHYEEVLVVRVRPENLDRQRLPDGGEGQGRVGPPLPGDQQLGAVPDRQRVQAREAVPEPVEGGAAIRFLQADGPAGEELEVLGRRRAGTAALGRLPAGVLGDAGAHQHGVGAVVRDPGRPEVVRPDLRGRRARPHADRDRPAVPTVDEAPATSCSRPRPTW